MAAGLRYLEIVKGTTHTDAELPMVVLIHGMGDKPHDGWVQDASIPMRVILPQAPTPHGTGFSWFPYRPEDADSEQLASDLHARSSQLAKMIDVLLHNRPVIGRPIVGGFSQGAMLTYALAVEHPSLVLTAIPVSGALPRSMWRTSSDPEQPGPPIFALHGDADPIVPITPARELVAYLKAAGRTATFEEYAGAGHEITPAMGRDFGATLDDALKRVVGLGEPPPEAPRRGLAAWRKDARALRKVKDDELLGLRASILLRSLDLSQDIHDARIPAAVARELARLAIERQGGPLHQMVVDSVVRLEHGPALCPYYQVLVKAARGYAWYQRGEFSGEDAQALARCVGSVLTQKEWEDVTGEEWRLYLPPWPMQRLIDEFERNLGDGDPAQRCQGLREVTKHMGMGHGRPGDDFIKYLACRITQHQHPTPDPAVKCLFEKYRPDGGHGNDYQSYSRLVRELRDMGIPAEGPGICMNAMLRSRSSRQRDIEGLERLAEELVSRAKESP